MDIPSIDPYKILGVPRDASSGAIKTAYRKGCLRCHPDKTTDTEKISEFHKIQQAFEIIGDEDKRQKYEDSLKLQSLRRDVFSSRRSPSDGLKKDYDLRTPNYDSRPTSHPTTFVNPEAYFYERAFPQFKERRPPPANPSMNVPKEFDRAPPLRRASEDHYGASHAQARKFNTEYSPPPPRRASASHQKPIPVGKPSAKTTQSDRELRERQDRAKQRERARKVQGEAKRFPFTGHSSESDDEGQYVAPQRSREAREDQEFRDRRFQQQSRSDDERRSRPLEPRAAEYTSRRGRSPEPTLSSRAPPRPTYRTEAFGSENTPRPTRDSRDSRPAPVRQRTSSVKREGPRREVPPSSATRPMPMPPFLKSVSSPSDIKIPSASSRRHTSDDHEDRPRSSPSMKPTLPRSKTMDVNPTPVSLSSAHRSRKPDPAPLQSSNLRLDPNDSGYGTQSSPDETTPKTRSSSYRYPSTSSPADLYEGHDFVTREPPHPTRRNTSGLSNPPSSSKYASQTYRTVPSGSPSGSRQPSLSRSNSHSQRSSGAPPTLPRGNSMPIPIKTGRETTNSPLLFNEFTSSPVEGPTIAPRRESAGTVPSITRRTVGRDGVSYSRTSKVNSSPVRGQDASGRSSDIRRERNYDDATAYMKSVRAH